MKIQDVKTYVVSQKLARGECFAYSQAWYDSRTIMLLKITTDDGIVGWGESFGPALVNRAIIEHYFKAILIGLDPLDTEVIWELLYNKFRDHCRKGNTVEAISAVDIALWDIKGKALGLPVYKLLGGSPREYLVPYATGMYRSEIPTNNDKLVKEAMTYVDQDYKALKLKIGFGLNDDVHAVAAVRKAVGPGVKLMLDANHAYNASSAVQLSFRLEEFGITWFEEPVPPEDINGYVEVKAKTRIPVAGGEAEFCRYGFNELLSKRAVDIVQPDCCVTGGISEFRKVAVLASINNIQCCPHVWGSAIALQAAIHCAFSLPDIPFALNPQEIYLEYDRTPNVFREELALEPVKTVNGNIMPPEKPGLGIEVDEKLIQSYLVR